MSEWGGMRRLPTSKRIGRHLGQLLPDEGGAAMVEFALVLPLLCVLVFGVFDFGRAWNAYQIMTDAARGGARLISVSDPTLTETAARDWIRQALSMGTLNPDLATIAIDNGFDSTTGSDAPANTPVTVTITYPYKFDLIQPFMAVWQDGDEAVTLSTTFVMRNE